MPSTWISNTRSVLFTPDWGSASGELSIFTARAGRPMREPWSPVTGRPVRGATGGGGAVVVVVDSVVVVRSASVVVVFFDDATSSPPLQPAAATTRRTTT